jgi:hypothetical protein
MCMCVFVCVFVCVVCVFVFVCALVSVRVCARVHRRVCVHVCWKTMCNISVQGSKGVVGANEKAALRDRSRHRVKLKIVHICLHLI